MSKLRATAFAATVGTVLVFGASPADAREPGPGISLPGVLSPITGTVGNTLDPVTSSLESALDGLGIGDLTQPVTDLVSNVSDGLKSNTITLTPAPDTPSPNVTPPAPGPAPAPAPAAGPGLAPQMSAHTRTPVSTRPITGPDHTPEPVQVRPERLEHPLPAPEEPRIAGDELTVLPRPAIAEPRTPDPGPVRRRTLGPVTQVRAAADTIRREDVTVPATVAAILIVTVTLAGHAVHTRTRSS